MSCTYKADGALASKTDAKGNTETYTYDTYQRLTEIQGSNGPVREVFIWRLLGSQTSVLMGFSADSSALLTD